jgi:hypothetical protein
MQRIIIYFDILKYSLAEALLISIYTYVCVKRESNGRYNSQHLMAAIKRIGKNLSDQRLP